MSSSLLRVPSALRGGLLFAAACVVVLGGVRPAQAEPALQLFVEGATYVGGPEESWVLNATTGDPFRIWAIGNAKSYPLTNVRLSVAYSGPDPLTITLTPTTTGGLNGFTDPSTPGAPTPIGGVHVVGPGGTDIPQFEPGKSLPPHGVFNVAGTLWQEFGLGPFTLTDSPIADFIDSFPVIDPTKKVKPGQINVYEVSVSRAVTLHFDLYAAGKVKAPFSHDAVVRSPGPTPAPPVVPEPGTLSLLALGAVGLGGYRWRRAKQAA
ncbi:MAG TPA: choice-of-anchor N protein [Planctomycetaceae bacterium]